VWCSHHSRGKSEFWLSETSLLSSSTSFSFEVQSRILPESGNCALGYTHENESVFSAL
jgi:hypothetical protein